jgi:hypothetical protein
VQTKAYSDTAIMQCFLSRLVRCPLRWYYSVAEESSMREMGFDMTTMRVQPPDQRRGRMYNPTINYQLERGLTNQKPQANPSTRPMVQAATRGLVHIYCIISIPKFYLPSIALVYDSCDRDERLSLPSLLLLLASFSFNRALCRPLALVPAAVFSLFCRKQRNSIPVARRVSASVFFTPSRLPCRPSSPGRRVYACEILLYKSESVRAADVVT